MNLIKLQQGQTVTLKKPHPCSGTSFRILHLGSDVKIQCIKCGRDLILEREKFEKSIKNIL